LDDISKALWTPDGVVRIGADKAEKVELRAGVMEWLRQFSDIAMALSLGVHCSRCGSDLVGHNADSDKRFTVVCKCREFIGTNRDYREVSH
jgi:hypothetical protein